MATSPDVPSRLPVAIEDHAYQIEPSGFKRETVQVLRQQADVSSEPGEASLNPQGLWRRSQESWHHGAGQDFLDGKTEEAADPHRFRSSKGIDPWTRGQISLLRPTLNVWRTTSTNLYLAVAQTITGPAGPVFVVYVADGYELYGAALPYSLLNTLALQRGTGWSTVNATIALSAVTDTWFRLTYTAGGAMSATSPSGVSGVPVDPGRSYGAVLQSNYLSGGAGRTPTITINWYTAAGAAASTPSASATAAGADTSGVTVYLQATAPADAAFAAVTAGYPAGVGGEMHEVRTIAIGPYDAVSTIGAPDSWFAASIQAGEAGQPIQSIATDGTYIWAALGTSGLHRTEAGGIGSTANVPAAPVSGQISLAGYANGFLLAAGSAGVSATRQNSLWLVADPLGTPSLSLIKTHPNPNFVWTGISSGRSAVYAYGNSGGLGEVYKVTFDPNTGTLSTAASPATFLPDGETIHALTFYAGGIIMGTGRGVRLGQADGAGNIDYGPLIETDWPVRCLEPQDRYCWFGWTKYDGATSGLGRVDLGYFTDTLTPAWASDLMTADPSTGDVVSAVTFAPYGYLAAQRPPVRVFTVAGEGVYIEDPGSRVPQGDIVTGRIRFSTSEPKWPRSLDIRHHALPDGASIYAFVEKDDDDDLDALGSSAVAGSYGPTVPITGFVQQASESFEFSFSLSPPLPEGTDFSRSPELTRWTAKVLPTPSTIDETFTIPLLMKREVVDNNDSNYRVDVPAEITYLKGLERSRALVTLQLGNESHVCYVVGSQFEGQAWAPGKTNLEGTLTVLLQTVRG